MKKTLFFLTILAMTLPGFAQMGIGTTNPNPSAMLDVTSSSMGFLAPRMTTTQRTAISAPANGLLVFDTDTHSLWIYRNSVWTDMGAGENQWHLTGNAGTSSLTSFLGTTDNNSLVFRTNNLQRMKIDSVGRLWYNCDVKEDVSPSTPFFHIRKGGIPNIDIVFDSLVLPVGATAFSATNQTSLDTNLSSGFFFTEGNAAGFHTRINGLTVGVSNESHSGAVQKGMIRGVLSEAISNILNPSNYVFGGEFTGSWGKQTFGLRSKAYGSSLTDQLYGLHVFMQGYAGATYGVRNEITSFGSDWVWSFASDVNVVNTTVTNVEGLRILPTEKGPTGTINQLAGIHIEEQTTGNSSINLLIGPATFPTGNFSIYSGSPKSSYFQGYMGIGTTAPIQILDVRGKTNFSSTPYGNLYNYSNNMYIGSSITGAVSNPTGNVISYMDVNSSTPINKKLYSGFFDLEFKGATNHSWNFAALAGQLQHAGTGTVLEGVGLRGGVVNTSTGTITNAYGFEAKLQNLGAGTVTNAIGVHVSDMDNSGGGTITNLVGVAINSQNLGTNNTYLLMGTTIPPAGNFGIHSIVSNPSYLAGKLGIGDTNPVEMLAVSGNASVTGKVTASLLHASQLVHLTPMATAPPSPVQGDIYYDSILNKLRVYDGATWQNCW